VDSWNPPEPTFGSDVDTLYSEGRARRRREGGRVVRRERDMDQDATLQHMCEWYVVSGLLANMHPCIHIYTHTHTLKLRENRCESALFLLPSHKYRHTLAPTPQVEGESILAACAPNIRDAC
jgi:hypothetical protein